MAKNICIVQGHPHATGKHFCHALAERYGAGARKEGAKVETLDLGELEVALLRRTRGRFAARSRPLFYIAASTDHRRPRGDHAMSSPARHLSALARHHACRRESLL